MKICPTECSIKYQHKYIHYINESRPFAAQSFSGVVLESFSGIQDSFLLPPQISCVAVAAVEVGVRMEVGERVGGGERD